MQNSAMLVSRSVHEIAFTVTFDANGGVSPLHSKDAVVGKPLGELPVPTFGDKYFAGWFTGVESGERVTEDTVAGIDVYVLHAHWVDPVEITWNATANGGTLVENSYKYYPGYPFGVLPQATGSVEFPYLDGWYTTQSEGGENITEDSIVPSEPTTYYARYIDYNDPIGAVICPTKNLHFDEFNGWIDEYTGSFGIEENSAFWRTGSQDSVYITGPDLCVYGLKSDVEGPGILSFYAMASTEGGYDGMVFFMDSVDMNDVTSNESEFVRGNNNNIPYIYAVANGDCDWREINFEIPNGNHTLYWLYIRDTSVSEGYNKTWLSGVQWRETR